MRSVHRHHIDTDFARGRAETGRLLISSALEDIDNDADALSAVRRRSADRLRYLLAVDSRACDEETWHAAVLASQAANAVFAASRISDGMVRYTIDAPHELPALGPNRLSGPTDWIGAAWLAVITQNQQRIQELCAVGQYTIRASGVQVDDYVYPWLETVQCFLRHEEVPPELFKTVMRLTEPEAARYTPRDFMLFIAFPPVQMFYYLLRRDAENFNNALAEALTMHRTYWEVPELAENPVGFAATAPLAIAILARAVGIPIEVESDYLPAGLLNGVWLGR
ncbi:immunity 49 family protein [Nocardia sp. NPDC051463]|uniref:immunity 49 family protein n=1 Tax=Nocardia sp. NPDC051463 TaxID=3154845 RepID=UPI003441DE70